MRYLRRVGIGLLLLAVSACGTLEISIYNAPSAGSTPMPEESSTPTLRPAETDATQLPLALTSNSETIRMKLLRSSDRWSTLWLDGIEIRYGQTADSEPADSIRHQVWVDQTSHAFRVLKGPAEGPDIFLVSDGQQVSEINLESGALEVYSLPPSSYAPFVPPEIISDTIQPHPMELGLGSPFGSLIFPAGLAQRRGQYEPVAMEWHAGRQTLVVDWRIANNLRPSRYWIDAQLGVILRAQDYGKQGGEVIESELSVERVLFDEMLEPQLFDPNPSTIPGFSDAHGHPEGIPSDSPGLPNEPDPLGEVYFFLVDRQTGRVPELVRLPGSCVAGHSDCPALDTVTTPFEASFHVNEGSWVWSPDGDLAVFVYQPSDGGAGSDLVVYEPAAESWRWLAHMPAIDLPAWSPDGQRIAFRVQDGSGRTMAYAVDRDGEDLRVLFEPEPVPGGNLAVEGWIGREVLVTTSFASGSGMAYAIDGESAEARIALEYQGARPLLIPSPDGHRLALATQLPGENGSALRMVSLQGETLQELGTFLGALYPIVWSPDGLRLAFYRYGTLDGEVLTVGSDGSVLSTAFSGEAISRLVFSPDGEHLLIEGGNGSRIVVLDLPTLQTRLLQAPGLGLDTSWRMASWRPLADR